MPSSCTHVNHLHEIGPARVAARAALDIPEDLFVVVGCGSVDRRKGADLFLEVAQKADAGFGTSLMFIWIGDGPELGDLRTAVIASGLQDWCGLSASKRPPHGWLPPPTCSSFPRGRTPFRWFAWRQPSTAFRPCISQAVPASANVSAPMQAARYRRWTLARHVARSVCSLPNQACGSRWAASPTLRLMTRYTAEIGARQLAFHLLNLADKAPHISVVVPTYNQAQFIRERLELDTPADGPGLRGSRSR